MDPAQRVLSLALGYRGTALVGTAVRLGVPDLITPPGATPDGLARRTGTDPVRMRQFLNALAAIGIVHTVPGGLYSLTEEGRLLTTAADNPLRHIARVAAEMSAPAATALAEGMSGASPFEKHFGTHVFNRLNERPDLASAYSHAVPEPNLFDAVATAYDFSGKRVVDLGGGLGDLLDRILTKHTTARGTLVELEATLQATSCPQGIDRVGADIRTWVPPGGDVYILCRVLANWDDETATTILRNCQAALKENGHLLIVEMVPLPGETEHALGDLDLLLHFGGRLRPLAEWNDLFAASGLPVPEATKLPAGWTILQS
ncbi:hypothetical protein AGRA3207_003479 [Actinomadura graeca]|uniref:O-methyltransferase n=1 Tax=Actinomadura graeca TaxID=2750812 RepID=A0ABX8QUI1_9ACTN|nr:acetylserotonin O-methyltransferase [Actinomadura graeca]QXJ22476.1 hypothetical protein AGRA3207_003479 [Actinomadura graeca]